jgi:hypothetical protein
MKQFFAIIILAALASGCHKSDDQPKYVLEGCKVNLRMIADAKELWASSNQKTENDTPTWDDLRPYMRGAKPQCPGGGVYTIGRVGEPPSCSIPEHTEHFKKTEK